MRATRLITALTLLAIVGWRTSEAAHAAEAPREKASAESARAAVRSDFNGIWTSEQGVLWDTAAGRGQPEHPPFTPQYAALYKQALDAAAAGKPLIDPPTVCLPPGTPRIMASPFPIEVVLTPSVVYLMFEYTSQVRRVYMDATAPQRIGLPTYNGYSTGHWDAQDLVIDTLDLLQGTVLDTTHLGHSDQLKVTEHLHLLSPTRMKAEITLNDPKAYTKPWTVVRTYVKKPGEQIMEYVCEENNRNPVSADGTTGFIGPK
ncbi:MAG: hypothetical protein JWO72_3045 [Caulobacteraceae bacterium]|nr:hypothetical protein [Caulobacteraceae bacterium]